MAIVAAVPFAAYQRGGVSSDPTFVFGSPPLALVDLPAGPYAESHDMCLAQFVAAAPLRSDTGISCARSTALCCVERCTLTSKHSRLWILAFLIRGLQLVKTV